MTAVFPGLSVRDSQILQLLRDGAPVQRVVEIGRHRKTWSPVHVGAVVAFQLGRPLAEPAAVPARKPPWRKQAECGTHSGYQRHLRLKENVCDNCRAAKRGYDQQRRAEKKQPATARPEFPVWHPEAFAGRATAVELTSTQADVLTHLCRGLSNGRIAIALSRSEDTIKSHVKDILATLGATDRTHAVVIVLTGQVRVHVRPAYRAAS